MKYPNISFLITFDTTNFFYRLKKDVDERACYQLLMQDPFLVHHGQANTNISSFVSDVLDNSTEEDEKQWRESSAK